MYIMRHNFPPARSVICLACATVKFFLVSSAFTRKVITPRMHVRSWVKQSVLSVSRSVSQLIVCLTVCKFFLKSCHIDPHKPSKGSQTVANSKNNCSMCTSWLKSRRFIPLYFGYFLLFITIHNIGSTSSWPQSPITNRTRSAFGNFMLRDDR